MKHRTHRHRSADTCGMSQKERGAVLLISVVTLTLLSLAGLSTVDEIVLQERTSVNATVSDAAGHNAEDGLQSAIEAIVKGQVFESGFCSSTLDTDPASEWECERTPPGSGYTYTITYIMDGEYPAKDEDGRTLYKIRVAGVKTGGNSEGHAGTSLAFQPLTAGVAVADSLNSAAIIGCERIDLAQNGEINGNALTTNASATVVMANNFTIDGDLNYTGAAPTLNNNASVEGSITATDVTPCDPLVVADRLSDLSTNLSDAGVSSSGLLDGPITLTDGAYLFDAVAVTNATIDVSGSVTLYVTEGVFLNNVTIRFADTSSELSLYIEGAVVAGSTPLSLGNVEVVDAADEAVAWGDQFKVYAGFGNSIVAGNCAASSSLVDIFGSSSQLGIQLYAPKATVCVRTNAQVTGTLRGNEIRVRQGNTAISSPGEDSRLSYSLLFYTRSDVDFYPGVFTNCLNSGNPRDFGRQRDGQQEQKQNQK